MEKGITVSIKESLWMELNKRKQPSESFNDVIERLSNIAVSFEDISKCKTIADVKKLTKEVLGE